MADNCTSPLIRDHAKIREAMGELRGNLLRFDLAGLRKAAREIKDLVEPHALKEESVLFLIGMKTLKADNKMLPGLFKEHHLLTSRLNTLCNLLHSGRLTDAEDQIQQLSFVIMESIDHHLTEEEELVFPALEKLLSPELKDLILSRYQSLNTDSFDELDRAPLISLPGLDEPDMNSGLQPTQT